MRLIDADALKANVPNTNVDIFENCRNCNTLMDWQVKELIDKMPTVDAVEKRIEGLQKLVDQNTERCEELRKQLREAHESYEKHINELEAQLQTIDAVEVVHCRDCKYWYPNGIGFCTIHDISPSQLDMADWFCADGERGE